MKLLKVISFILLFALFFLIDASFRVREFEDKDIDFQVILKLIVLMLSTIIGVYSFLYYDFYKRYLPVLVLFAYILLTSLWSLNALFTVSIFLSFFSYFLFINLFITKYGFPSFLKVVCLSFFCFLIYSFFLYFFFPEEGRYVLWINDIYAPTWRMTGLSTSANNFARICAVYLFILWFFRDITSALFSKLFIDVQFVACISALIMSGSRTTIFLSFFTIAIYAFIKSERLTRFYLFFTVLAFFVVLYPLSPYFLDLISRDGGSDLASFTGRSFIWDASKDIISEKMIFGHGFGSSIYLLPDYSDFLGFTPPHAHNMYLQILMSGGVVGMVIFLLCLLYYLLLSLKSSNLFCVFMLFFICAVGVFESGAISLTSNTMTLLLFIVMYISSNETRLVFRNQLY